MPSSLKPLDVERDIRWMARITFGCGPVLLVVSGLTNSYRWALFGVVLMALAFAGPGLSSASFDLVKGVARFNTRRR